ncbi:ribonuclease HII [Ureibacillus sp. FSL K6-8385]|uniref:Ribonuclease HII n=1 Tax=Ureibacillus terrenus TaxID=118246 RepID=A0A540V4D7_9BACL|nr:ribonuclease HII [Ureibacillus terrenus]MED3660380.1 ribonuclease HII [Ureibacillus terrenus]MED3762536.1 ribonuclease HII [Ureibacillus terrenus]TQE91602.1 ribonuclease HII [Ureibacillus terrenus]
MKTIKEITEALKRATAYEPWMQELEKDGRASVQKALRQFQKRLEKQEKLFEQFRQKQAFDASFLPFEGAYLAGVDEAGRGPLAGPVVTCAVILPKDCPELIGINDSKQLSKKKRAELAELIKKHALAYSIHFQSAKKIDELNILEATRQSMKICIENLKIRPDICLVDAVSIPIGIPQESIVKGDAKSLAIGAASILAKHERDLYMEELHTQYPQYGFDQNAGYGTKQHLEAIERFGPTVHHRKTFEPIKSMLEKKVML